MPVIGARVLAPLLLLSGCAGQPQPKAASSPPAPSGPGATGGPIAASASSAASTSSTAGSPDCSLFWLRMSRQLPGTWQADLGEGKRLIQSFSLLSNESALLEEFITPSGKKTISVYHPAQQSLMLTHYCGQGNQPRLRSAEVSEDSLVLRFLDATNVSTEASVLVEKRLQFLGDDAFDQTETYRASDGTLEATVFHFKRVLEPVGRSTSPTE